MRITLFIIIGVLLFSCNESSKKPKDDISETIEETSWLIQNPAGGNSQLPRLFSHKDVLYMSWVTRTDTADILKFSQFSEQGWDVPETVATGNDWFTNWADFPTIASNNGNILAHYLEKSASGTYTYDIKLNFFSKEKQEWKKNFILHDDRTQSEHGFVSMLPYKEKDFFVTWLDGRYTTGNHGTHEMNGNKGAMTLRGAFISNEGAIYDDMELDKRVCDCCQTGAAMTSSGPVVVYRDRSDDEIRDISIVRWQENVGWTSPMPVYEDHWKIEGCPVNGPAIDANGTGLAVAWFSEAKGKPKVQVIFSEDDGVTFGIPIRVDINETIGRVDVAMADSETAVVCWLEDIDDETFIQLRKVRNNGGRGPVLSLSQTKAERASGFPQLTIVGTTLVVAWTEVISEGNSELKTAQISLEAL